MTSQNLLYTMSKRSIAVTLWLFAAVALPLLHAVESKPSALDKLLVETIETLLQEEAQQEIAQDENKHGKITACTSIMFCLRAIELCMLHTHYYNY